MWFYKKQLDVSSKISLEFFVALHYKRHQKFKFGIILDISVVLVNFGSNFELCANF